MGVDSDLSLRGADRREVTEIPKAGDKYRDCQHRRLLLIHGFAVNEASAVSSMSLLRDMIGRRSAQLAAESFTVTWPGDKALYRGGPLRYPAVVPVAKRTAAVLYEHFRNTYARPGQGPRELVIVAHSLGCRVALELLRRIWEGGRPVVLDKFVVILMAAAVQTDEEELITASVDCADQVAVLHSLSDWILKWTFPIGQWMAGGGALPEAIGRRGGPPGAGFLPSQPMHGYGHRDYWPRDLTAEVICNILRPIFEDVAIRYLPSDNCLATHVLPFSEPIASHTVATYLSP